MHLSLFPLFRGCGPGQRRAISGCCNQVAKGWSPGSQERSRGSGSSQIENDVEDWLRRISNFCCSAASGEQAGTGHRALDIKTIGLLHIEHWPKAEFQDEQGTLDQKAAQLGAVGIALGELDEQGFDVSAWRMWAFAQT